MNKTMIRYSDLRKTVGVAASTFSSICKKVDIPLDSHFQRNDGARFFTPAQARKILESRGYSYGPTSKVMAFIMCKGGVGKTTSTFFISQRLAAYGAKVLVIDSDSQGNLSSAFHTDELGYDIDEQTPVLVDLVTRRCSAEEAIVVLSPNLHLIPSTPFNSTLDGKLRDLPGHGILRVSEILTQLKHNYDYILIDCAPALNLSNASIIRASNKVVLPVCLDKFSQIGLVQTLSEIESMEKDFQFSLDKRILITKFDLRESITFRYLGDIASQSRNIIYNTMVRVSSDISVSISNNQDLFALKNSTGKKDYDDITREIMEFSFVKDTTTSHRAPRKIETPRPQEECTYDK